MKEYIKPTFTLAGLFPVALAGSGCTTNAEDIELLCEIYGIKDVKNAFAEGEECADKYPVEGYCKLTLDASMGKLLTS